MKSKVLIGVILLIGLSAVLFVVFPQKSQLKSYPTQTDEKGAVLVSVTPKVLEGGKEVQFELRLNTHSVSLDYNFKEISRFTDNKGKTYKPLSWNGGKGGHHIEGVLTFPPLIGKPGSVKLFIAGIDNNDREFVWKLQG